MVVDSGRGHRFPVRRPTTRMRRGDLSDHPVKPWARMITTVVRDGPSRRRFADALADASTARLRARMTSTRASTDSSPGAVAGASIVALGPPPPDPFNRFVMTSVLLVITWDSW